MWTRHALIIVLLFFMLLALFKLLFSESYQMSVEAKMHYEMGDYKKAQELSRMAFELDRYNRMAFTLMAQSKISLEIEEFVYDSKNTYAEISHIVSKPNITAQDRIKIKLMCEVVLGRYAELTSATKMTDKELYKDANEIYLKIKRLYEDVYK